MVADLTDTHIGQNNDDNNDTVIIINLFIYLFIKVEDDIEIHLPPYPFISTLGLYSKKISILNKGLNK